jgi:hypothetical protein
MRGRLPAGPEYIDKLKGSPETKERLKAILDTLYGEARVLEVCAQLGLGETRFHQLREAALQAALTAIEPRPAGRPSRTTSTEAERIDALERRVRELEQALHEAQVREEIALVLPHVQRTGPGREGSPAGGAEKKTPSLAVKIRKPR